MFELCQINKKPAGKNVFLYYTFIAKKTYIIRKKPPKLSPAQIGTFIDPITDFGFKRLFGSEPNKDILIDFLNALFAGKRIITDLKYSRNEQAGNEKDSRKMIFDVHCTGAIGEKFVIEVQRIRQEYFKDRAIYYSSRLIHDQGLRGKEWDYHLSDVFFIGIMDSVLDDSDEDEYI